MKLFDYENEKRLAVFALLHGITSISVTFEGSGDSGQIDRVDAFMNNFKPFDMSTPIEVTVRQGSGFNHATKQWEEHPPDLKTIPFHEFLDEHVSAVLEDVTVNWYDNDGGGGEWAWRPESGVEFHVDQRTVMVLTETAHYEERTLGYPEEVDEDEQEAS